VTGPRYRGITAWHNNVASDELSLPGKGGALVKYLLYVLRWVVLAIPGALFFNKAKELLGIENVYLVMVISQAVMGAMVYFLDKLIFTSGAVSIPWDIKPKGVCSDCGRVGKCYRVAGTKCCEGRDNSEGCSFRCEECAVKRMKQMS
jgi:hypothetical protein